ALISTLVQSMRGGAGGVGGVVGACACAAPAITIAAEKIATAVWSMAVLPLRGDLPRAGEIIPARVCCVVHASVFAAILRLSPACPGRNVGAMVWRRLRRRLYGDRAGIDKSDDLLVRIQAQSRPYRWIVGACARLPGGPETLRVQ